VNEPSAKKSEKATDVHRIEPAAGGGFQRVDDRLVRHHGHLDAEIEDDRSCREG